MKLNIGCGRTHLPDFVNVDAYPLPGYTDMVFDCQEPWPLPVNSVSYVEAHHVFEHLPRWQGFLDAAWDALQHDGRLHLVLPHGANTTAWIDPTHVRPWWPLSFVSLLPGYLETSRNGQYSATARHWGVEHCLVHIRGRWRWAWPFRRVRWVAQQLAHWIDYIPHLYCNIHITLLPLKTTAAIEGYCATHPPSMISVDYCTYEGQRFQPLVSRWEAITGGS